MRGTVDLCGCAGVSGSQDGRPAVPLLPTTKDDEEGTAEGLVEEGIEDWVQHGVDVTQPQAGDPQLLGYCVVYEWVHHISDKEWCPTEAKTSHNDAEGLCCLGFCSHAVVALMVSRICTSRRSSRPLQHTDLQSVCSSCDVDPLVSQHHEDQRDVEGYQRAGEGIWLVDHEDTGGGVVAPAEAFLINLEKKEKENHKI